MTIQKHRGENYVVCDECGCEFTDKRGNTAFYDPKDFDILIDDLREAGWRSYREAKQWFHTCPEDQ